MYYYLIYTNKSILLVSGFCFSRPEVVTVIAFDKDYEDKRNNETFHSQRKRV